MTNYLQKSKSKSKNVLIILSIFILFLFVTPSFQSEATYYNNAYVLKSWDSIYILAFNIKIGDTNHQYTNVYYNTSYFIKNTTSYVCDLNNETITYRYTNHYESY